MVKPPRRIYLDFETYSELDLPKVGAARYAEHPSTEVLCLAWAVGAAEPELWVPGDPPPGRLFDLVARGALLYAWNAGFEVSIWEEVCAARMGWPEVPFEHWRDSQAVALSYALPAKLGQCGEALGLAVTKDPRGEHLVRKLSRPRRPSKHDPSTRWTPEKVPGDFADFYAYCLQDVRAERAIVATLPRRDLPPGELEVWRATNRMNARGWAVDWDSVDRITRLLGEREGRALRELEEVTLGLVRSPRQVGKSRRWLAAQGVHLPNLQADTIEAALLNGSYNGAPLGPKTRRFLEVRRELAKSSVAKYGAMVARRCDDGTVKDNLLYHGATTGRDAGRGIQIQNFPRAAISKTGEGVELAFRALKTERPLETVELFYGSAPHYASMLLRSVLVARPGYDLVAADFSQIENRVAVWIADCPHGISIYEQGLDEYQTFAANFYRVAHDDVTAKQRQHGKGAILGCVFGMGAEKMVNQAAQHGQSMELDVAKKTVREYRELYPGVVQCWKDLNRAAIGCVDDGRPRRANDRVGFEVRGRFLLMVLPSGRRIAYPDPRVEMLETPWGELRPTLTHARHLGQSRVWGRGKAIPGLLFENAVQATARDAMMEGALAVAAAGYEPVGRVHDEVVAEVPEGEGDLAEFERLVQGPPAWLRGIPIVAKGWRGKRYRK